MTVRIQIEALGGVSAAGRLLGLAPTTVHYWCKKNRIPAWRQRAVDEALAALGELQDLRPPFPKDSGR
jgi:DNA-binding transcriptional regulator YdaS (Cro superfamily)